MSLEAWKLKGRMRKSEVKLNMPLIAQFRISAWTEESDSLKLDKFCHFLFLLQTPPMIENI